MLVPWDRASGSIGKLCRSGPARILFDGRCGSGFGGKSPGGVGRQCRSTGWRMQNNLFELNRPALEITAPHLNKCRRKLSAAPDRYVSRQYNSRPPPAETSRKNLDLVVRAMPDRIRVFPRGIWLRQDVKQGRSPGGKGIGRCAVRLVPTCALFLVRLREKYSLEVPEEEEGLLACITEVCDDLLEVAEKTEAAKDGENIIVTLSDYRLSPGCRAVRAASPKCCTMVGCPVCSLLATLAALGTGRPTWIEHATVDEKRKTLRVILKPERITPLTAPSRAPSSDTPRR